ncbi:centrosomal protein 43-like, partial [Anoplopoma fimbria]|uniref:centrosomal protein 43-like n=1 Tax=Anoplopoma fimbria TaxID=229290 RepID=UPI0023EBDE73
MFLSCSSESGEDSVFRCRLPAGRLVAGLIVDFLQVFNLDFSLAVFQPEINSLNGVDSRDLVLRDLGLSESEVNRKCPLLLELVKRGRHRAAE